MLFKINLNCLSTCSSKYETVGEQAMTEEVITLFVGEGDFSFSANYILNIKTGMKEKIYATCLNHGSLTPRQQHNIKMIEINGGIIYTDVDATTFESHPIIKELKLTNIIFNFPHIPGKMNICKNRKLVQQFFISAKKILCDSGTIYVTLCQGQGGTEIEKIERKWCDSWQIVRLAASASLILKSVKLFDVNCFKTYECTGYRGLEKPFNTKGALTHIFSHGNCIEDIFLIDENIKNSMITKLFILNCKRLHRNIFNNSLLPCSKVSSTLKNITSRTFACHHIYIDELLICKSFMNPFLEFDSSDIDICFECINNLFLYLLKEEYNDHIIAIDFNVCCVKNIHLNGYPFKHMLLYISSSSTILLTNLQNILQHLAQEYSFTTKHEQLYKETNDIFEKYVQIIENKTYNNEVYSDKRKRTNLNIYASFSLHKGDEYVYYSNIKFFLSFDDLVSKKNELIKIGNVIHYQDNFNILLNLHKLACLKFHIMDYRILFLENAFYVSSFCNGHSLEIYRSPSIYPPKYVHDTSFYIENDFSEINFFLLVWNTLGLILKSVTLIETYFNDKLQKYSRCYRFLYQSCDKALTKEKANIIHTQFMRNNLKKSLNICLR